jgi:phosphoribosylanthranilate isomerase
MSLPVKICGIRRAEDAVLAVEFGAAALGFVFWPDSPRFIDPYRACLITSCLPLGVTAVGVFADQSAEYVFGVARLLNLGAVQLHGGEPPCFYQRSTVPVIKAVAVTNGFEPEHALAAIPTRATVLLDAHDPVKKGGTGRVIDWSKAAAAARVRPIILSGGLTSGNVRSAVEAVKPYAIDVSSGVESSPGVKDPDKLRAFFDALHSSLRNVVEPMNPLNP